MASYILWHGKRTIFHSRHGKWTFLKTRLHQAYTFDYEHIRFFTNVKWSIWSQRSIKLDHNCANGKGSVEIFWLNFNLTMNVKINWQPIGVTLILLNEWTISNEGNIITALDRPEKRPYHGNNQAMNMKHTYLR